MKWSKFVKLAPYDSYAALVIALAGGLRLLLVALGWPPTNSDEGTMGIMALHIAYRGEHPQFFYGQDYMGAMEAYLGAFFFHLFGGPSLFALRCGVILLITLFFIAIYLLSSLLFSKELGLMTLIVLSVGSIPYLTRQTLATGGSSQTLLFGSVAFLLATWHALTYRRDVTLRTRLWRFAGYACWGLVVGLGLWSDMVVAPFFAMAALLLVLFCWRDLLWAWPGLLAGITIGMLPSLLYSQEHHISPIKVLLGLFQGSQVQAPRALPEVVHGIKATVLVSIPTATGYPFCPVQELPFLGDSSPHTPICTVVHAAWGGGYVLLLALALFTTLSWWQLHSKGKSAHVELTSEAKHRTLLRALCILILLGSGVLAISGYALSSAPMGWPGFRARYLIGLLIITPALLAPVWSAARMLKPQTSLERVKMIASRVMLIVVCSILLVGTIMAFSEVPQTQKANQQRQNLINNLLQIGATHIYTDYWSCYSIAFESNERIICGVVNGQLAPSHNRDPRYYRIVHADPRAAYVFPLHSSQLRAAENLFKNGKPYKRYTFNDYVVFQPG